MFRKILMVAVTIVLPLQSMANDLHLKLPEAAFEVLAPKQNALSLKEVNAIVVEDQKDLQISYERLLQAQKRISVARAQYFPYGLGTIAAMYFFNVWSSVLLVELGTSLPSKIYHVQSEKNMSIAQEYSNQALKENIKNQVAHLYYNILKEEGALKLANMEISLLETLYSTTQDKISLGLATEEALRSIELRMLDLRDVSLGFSGYLSEEKAAFNSMVSQMPSVAKKISLQNEGIFLDPEKYDLGSDIIEMNALERSPEIVSADYIVRAALKSKKSEAWSVLSFNGIGFGYWGRVQVARSQIELAKLNREFVERNLSNQAYVLNNSFHRSLDYFLSEQEVFNDTALFYEGELARFKAHDIALDELAESGILYLKDFREMVAAHYDSLKKLNDLERIALGSVQGSASGAGDINVIFTDLSRKKVSLSINSAEEIKSVEYIFDSNGLRPMLSTNTATDFEIILKLYDKNISGQAKITLKNKKIITKSFSF